MVEVVVFAVAGAACLVGAVGVVLSRNPVHAALMLVMTLFGIAVLFVALQAHFIAAVQVIVYAGAIVVLFLFVIMLLGVDRAAELSLGALPAQRWTAAAFGIGGAAVLVWLVAAVFRRIALRRRPSSDATCQRSALRCWKPEHLAVRPIRPRRTT